MTTILYERLGGADGITAIVDAVVEAHMSNPAISADSFHTGNNLKNWLG